MGISRTEVNLLRLLDSAPRQENQAKLIHYITTSKGLLEQLAAETAEGVSSVSKAKLIEYSDKIEVLAAVLSPEAVLKEVIKFKVPLKPEMMQKQLMKSKDAILKGTEVGSPTVLSSGLRRRLIDSQMEAEQVVSEKERDAGAPIRLDGAAQARIDKYRQLQEGSIDEMIKLAHQLNESSLILNQSLQEMEKILDSTETAVEHSLAGTSHAKAHAVEVYSLASKTSCLQWLLFFVMICMFTMVVLLIRIT